MTATLVAQTNTVLFGSQKQNDVHSSSVLTRCSSSSLKIFMVLSRQDQHVVCWKNVARSKQLRCITVCEKNSQTTYLKYKKNYSFSAIVGDRTSTVPNRCFGLDQEQKGCCVRVNIFDAIFAAVIQCRACIWRSVWFQTLVMVCHVTPEMDKHLSCETLKRLSVFLIVSTLRPGSEAISHPNKNLLLLIRTIWQKLPSLQSLVGWERSQIQYYGQISTALVCKSTGSYKVK